MPDSSERDAFELARAYRKMAARIDDYVFDNFDELSRFERYRLMRQEGLLEQAALQLLWEGASDLLSELGEATEDIKNTTNNVNAAIDKLDDVNDVLGAASAAVNLVSALMMQDYPGAAKQAKLLKEAAQELLD